MPNKPHKFGIKFWLAVDVQTKYILYGYMGKDETQYSREKGQDDLVLVTPNSFTLTSP